MDANQKFREWLWEETGKRSAVPCTEARKVADSYGVKPTIFGALISQSRHVRVGEEYRRIEDTKKKPAPARFVEPQLPPEPEPEAAPEPKGFDDRVCVAVQEASATDEQPSRWRQITLNASLQVPPPRTRTDRVFAVVREIHELGGDPDTLAELLSKLLRTEKCGNEKSTE